MSGFNRLPGFWFHPKDFEIIGYLISEINGDRIPGTNGLIFQADVFGEVPPWDLFSNTDADAEIEDVRFFFTFLKKITKNGSNFKRNVGNIGKWKGENRGVPIEDPKTKHVIGERKSYSFRLNHKDDPRKQRRDHGDCRWLMTEYSTRVSGKDKKSRCSDYVICRIKKKKLHPDNNVAAAAVSRIGTSTPSWFEQYFLSHFNFDNPQIPPVHGPLLLSPQTEPAELQPNHNNLIDEPSQQYAYDYSPGPGLEKNTCAHLHPTNPHENGSLGDDFGVEKLDTQTAFEQENHSSVQLENIEEFLLQDEKNTCAHLHQTNPQICAHENQVPQPVGDDFGVGKSDTQTAFEEDNHCSPQLENIEESLFRDVNMDDFTCDQFWQDEFISQDQDNLILPVTEDGPFDYGLWCF